MRTLLTGASGYIGLHIVRELLDDGQQVTAVVRSPEKLGPFLRHPLLEVVQADLLDPARIVAALPGHDVCIHAALIWGEPGSELDVRDVAVTAKLFNAAGRAGVARCIYLSSAAVHRPFVGEMGEDDPLRPADPYGATKAAGELFLRAACAQHQMTGVVVRPGPVVGPPAFAGASFRSPERIAQLVRAATEGRSLDVVSGEGRQFSDMATVARAVRLLTRAENPQPTYLCVDRDIVTWERVTRIVVERLESSSNVRVAPRDESGPIPRFRTQRIESLLGGPSNAEVALLEHVRQLSMR